MRRREFIPLLGGACRRMTAARGINWPEGKNFSILINPANGTCPDPDEVIVSGYCFTSGNRVPFPSMELLGNNRSAACSPPGAAIQMVLVCAKP